MSSRNESAKIISCLSDQMDRVENKIDAVLLNSNGIHDAMQSIMGELDQLRAQRSDASLIEKKSTQSVSSLS